MVRALRASGVEIAGLHGTRAEAGGADGEITAGVLPRSLRQADVVLVTVRDAQLEGALDELAAAPPAAGTVVLHASGSQDPGGLGPLRASGHPAGTFHPLVPLADPAQAARRLRGAWIGVDGDPPAVAAARELADALGARVLPIPAGEKPRYHAAAVFAANFPTVLAATAVRLLEESGVSSPEATDAVTSLMAAAAENLRGGSAAQMLTGPVARGDVETVVRHLDALRGDASAQAVYRVLTRVAVVLARDSGVEHERLAAFERLTG